MALERKVLFERLEIDKDDNVSILLKKAVVDGNVLVAEVYHRVLIPAGANAAEYLDAVQTAIIAEGYPALPAAIRQRVSQAKTFVSSLPAIEKPARRAR